ncbi:hypothetical protein GGF50DRAFT_131927 [Schizophyllum commune]
MRDSRFTRAAPILRIAGIVLLCEQLKACQMEIQRDRTRFDLSAFFPPPPRDLPALSRHGSLLRRRPRPDDSSPPTTISASSGLVVADGELAPDLASTTRTTFPTPTTPNHSPFPHRPRRRRGLYPRSTLAVTRGRNFVDIGNILRYWVHNYRLTRYLTPRPRRQTCPFETATCGAVSPFPSACATTTDLDPSHLKQRAAVLIDARAFPVRAPSTTSRNDAGMHSLPPTTIRDSQAWETGGSLQTAVPEPPEARADPLDEFTNADKVPGPLRTGREANDTDFSDPKPPEASACTIAPLPLARGKGEVLRRLRRLISPVRAPSATDAGGVGVRQTATASRADTREGEGVHLRRGHAVTR